MMQRLFQFSVLLSAFFAIAAMDPPSQPIMVPPEQAAKEGRALVDEILSQQPEPNTVTGTLAIRTKTNYTQIPIKFQTVVTSTNWISIYEATEPTKTSRLTITHVGTNPGEYGLSFHSTKGLVIPNIKATETTNQNFESNPFAGSDFSFGDLGLEFLHWPDQKLLQKEMRRSRSCRVLESTNPHPTPGSYAKVKSWVDNESHGILLAQAFDAKGDKVKEFEPKDFSKVDGQWQLQEMQIRNVKTDSATTVKFNLGK
jgi:hypothetical protein